MKLLESYSKICGVDIKRSLPPELPEAYISLPDKYITVMNSSGMSSKNYDLWQDVIDYMLKFLSLKKISIVQLGESSAPALNGVMDYRGVTSIHQSAYAIYRSLCHIGNDSWLNYLCATSNTPLVSLYGPTTIENHSPFHLPKVYRFFESHRYGLLPSFSPHEFPKTINLIPPEDVANAILEILGFGKNCIKVKTIYIGQQYGKKSLEIIPNSDRIPNISEEYPYIVRMDKHFSIENLYKIASVRPCFIFSDKEIDLDFLRGIAPRILSLGLFVSSKNISLKYLTAAKLIGINVVMLSDNEATLSMDRNIFFDHGVVQQIKIPSYEEVVSSIKKYLNKDIELPSVEKWSCSSRSLVFSGSDLFLTLGHAEKNVFPVRSLDFPQKAPMFDSSSVWADLEKLKLTINVEEK